MGSPLVSVILFAHAPYAKFLDTALKSVLSQSYKNIQVLVLGDGSVEVERAVNEFRKDQRINLISQGNLPFLVAANEQMKTCQGEYLGTWNSDDIYGENHVRVLVEALETDREAGAAFDNVEYFNGDDGTSLGVIIPQSESRELAKSHVSLRKVFDKNFMTGPSSIIRKSVFERVGGYDGKTSLNSDLHWFYRIAAYFPVRFVDYIGVRKRIHPLNNTARTPHYERGVIELEDIRDHYPEVYRRIGTNTFNKKLGRKYFRLGLYYDRLGEKCKATDAHRQATLLRQFNLRYRWEYIRSLL